MIKIPLYKFSILISRLHKKLVRHSLTIVICLMTITSVASYLYYLNNGLALSYNDARSHLDIGRRVVEGLKPGLAQLGSVWLPLNHILMVPLIWNDWMWHSGFAGAVWNMLSFIGTGVLIFKILERINVGLIGRTIGVITFAANINILYLQSTAMTEPLLLFTMTAGCYYLIRWHQQSDTLSLIKAAFWIMMATLVRYDGWFLLGVSGLLVMNHALYNSKQMVSLRDKVAHIEGVTILFSTLAVTGVFGWFMWNLLIFKDPLYFMLGEFSAHAQQLVMESAGVLPTKWDLLLSIKVYMYALLYSSYTVPFILSVIGAYFLTFDKQIDNKTKVAMSSLWAPLIFNILALYLGFSVIYVQGISGDTWFNIRYGVMLSPTIAIMIGYLVDRYKSWQVVVIPMIFLVTLIGFVSSDSVAIDDARVGSSQKNVSEVSGYLEQNAKNEKGFILISAASHDAIIFSSKLPMKRYIHEGTGKYWESATTTPDHWARWIVMRTYDDADLTWRAVSRTPGFANYQRVAAYPFADVYELKPEFMDRLQTEAVIKDNK